MKALDPKAMREDAEQERIPWTPETLDYTVIEPGDLSRDVFLQYLAGTTKKFADDIPDWAGYFLVAVSQGREEETHEIFTDLGMDAWLPYTTEEKQAEDRTGHKRKGRPRKQNAVQERFLIYKGFVLLRFAPSPQAYHAINAFRRVIGIVAHPRAFDMDALPKRRLSYALSKAHVKRLRDMEAEVRRPDDPLDVDALSAGSVIRVLHGPFQGFTGTVTDKRPAYKMVHVELSIFGRQTPTELLRAEVEPVVDGQPFR